MNNDSDNNNNRPIKMKNIISGEQTVDLLHLKYKNNNKSHNCNEIRCLGSMLDPKPVEHRVRTPDETREQAIDFINNYYASIKRLDSVAHKNRLKEVEEQIKTTDTYYLKETELIYGAKLAWRNAPRCIGRIQWSKLQVFDARFIKNETEMFEALCNHIKYATNKGSLRSAITILPQRVKSTAFDWRIWNSQLISYAGYRNKETGAIVGDPLNADFTEICLKLGWKGSKGTRFDVLPLVLSANGGPPQLFPLPDDLIMRVKLKHPRHKWFEELGLEWYALPAVSGMMLDLGGLQFTACPFSGWYMVTEIGTRDLGDVYRYNVLEDVAQRMGLNTSSNNSLWRDRAVVELNVAVLDSFQSAGVTIVDHHTASETFMTHLANEQRLRGGCPADWVWLVPPTAGSTTQVFHQEMVNYHLLPNYEYMEPPWKNFNWLEWEHKQKEQKELRDLERRALAVTPTGSPNLANATGQSPLLLKIATGDCSISGSGGVIGGATGGLSPLSLAHTHQRKSIDLSPSSVVSSNGDLTPRRLRFKEIARAVKFTSKLFGKALSRRIKATILYATETGKSERFANKLAQTFSCAFNVHLMSMSDYDMTCLEHEALLLIVTSTFGNGDPPENGEAFAKHIAAVKLTGDTSPDLDSINSVSTNPFFQMLSEDQKDQQGAAVAAAVDLANKRLSSRGQSDASNNNNNLKSLPTDESSENYDNEESHNRRQLIYKRIQEQQTNIRPLSNVRFSVFALGSTAYPHFCAFGRYVDQTLGELGAERISKCTCGDELAGQEKVFNEWSSEVFKIACDVFCLTDSIGPIDARPEVVWSPSDVRFAPIDLIDSNGEIINNSEQQLQQQQQQMSPTSKLSAFQSIGNRYQQLQQQRDLSFDQHKATIDLLNNNGNSPLSSQQQFQQQPVRSSSEILSNKKTIVQNLMAITSKKIVPFTVKARQDLHSFIAEENLQTLNIDLECDLVAGPCQTTPATSNRLLKFNLKSPPIQFEPGDHVGIYPINKREVVERILARIQRDLPNNNNNSNRSLSSPMAVDTTPGIDFDQVYRVLVRRENMDLTPAASNPLSGSQREADNWITYDRLPITSIREALTRYLDITNPPNQEFLATLARLTSDLEEKKQLQQMARNFKVYEEWKNKNVPTLLSTLEEFKMIRFDPALITQMPLMKPRFYSISGTGITLTLGVVRFKTASGELREGLCSNYLNTVPIGPKSYIYGYIRSAPAFHMPQNKAVPMILIGAGTGIAPFRSFWQKRSAEVHECDTNATQTPTPTQTTTKIVLTGQQQRNGITIHQQTSQTNQSVDGDEKQSPTSDNRRPSKSISFGRIELYFGCRNSNYILYKDELDQMYNNGILSSINIAFSRPIDRDVLAIAGQQGPTNNSKGAAVANVVHPMPPTNVNTIPSSLSSSLSSSTSSSSSTPPRNIITNTNHQQVVVVDGSQPRPPLPPPVKRGSSKVETIKQARKKMYVQDKLLENSNEVFKLIMSDEAHVYVCGDVAMADGVYKTLAKILSKETELGDGESILMNLRNLNRYHEDIFGAKQMS